MELVVLIIMLLVSLSFALKLTAHRPWGVLLLSGVVALFVAFSWDAATEQSKTQIADWLGDTSLMLDLSVLLTVDVVMSMAFCVFTAQKEVHDRSTRLGLLLRLFLKWIPGLLIFPTLFGVLVYTIFAFPGVAFTTIAYTLAALLFVLFVLLGFGLKWLLPELDLRLELTFLVNALIAILGIIATVNGRTAVEGTSEVEWGALAGILIIFLCGALAGWLYYQRKIRKQKI
jgi:hypothetical protein